MPVKIRFETHTGTTLQSRLNRLVRDYEKLIAQDQTQAKFFAENLPGIIKRIAENTIVTIKTDKETIIT